MDDHLIPLRGRCVVLYSGGWDSVLCAIVAMRRGHVPVAAFVRYGQPYERQEYEAVRRSAEQLALPLRVLHLPTMPMDDAGSFDRRNAWLLAAVFAEGAASAYFGTRCPLPAFDRHGDANAVWARAASRTFGRPIYTPALLHPKPVIKARVRTAGVEPWMIFSTEGWRPE